MIIECLRRYEGKIVVVTGASGYIGSALSHALGQTAASVVPVSRRPVAHRGALTGDIRALDIWTEIARRADIVFHLAGNTSVYTAARDTSGSLASTVLPIAHLVAAARAARRRIRVVFASTATVYGLTSRTPVGEETEPHPVTTYDRHKLSAERQLEQATGEGVVDATSLRLANVYGPSPGSGAEDRGVLNRMARLALDGSPLPLYGGGRYLRDYVYIDDVVRAFLAAGACSELPGALNVGSGVGTTVRDAFQLIAERAERVSGRTVVVQDAPWPDGADPIETRNFVADIQRIATACGWGPTVPLQQGIDRLTRQHA